MCGEGIDIIIPTRNGGQTLLRTLTALAAQVAPRDRVHVVLNGCIDDSVAAAGAGLVLVREKGAHGVIIECAAAGRPSALTAGDAAATGDRVYLDHDVILSDGGLALIRSALRGGADFACGEARWRTPSPWVRSAMNAWNRLPYVCDGRVTAGMFAVSKSGRLRWTAWPGQLPDDKWARLHFRPSERVRIPELYYSVAAPATFSGLVEIRRRYNRSNRALAAAEPVRLADDVPRSRGLTAFALDPRQAPGSLILAAAELTARMRP